MGDHLKKVRAGDTLAIPAKTYNAFIDATADFQQRTRNIGQRSTPAAASSGIILVRNDSGVDRSQFEILGIDGPIISPSDNSDEFARRVAVKGVTPTDEHAGKFVICAEPIASGAIGRAYVGGACPVQVIAIDDDAASYPCAEVLAGVAAALFASPNGSAAILWRESGAGAQWALVRLGASQPTPRLVKVAKDGGDVGGVDQGDGTYTSCTLTYTVTSLDGLTTLAAAKTPLRPRYAGVAYSAGGEGGATDLGLWNPVSEELIVVYGEIDQTNTCPEGA